MSTAGLTIASAFKSNVMKPHLLVYLLLFISTANQLVTAQVKDDELLQYYLKRQELKRNGMIFLGSAGLANIGLGLGMAGLSNNAETQAFGRAHAVFGGVNLGIAVLGSLVEHLDDEPETWYGALENHYGMEKAFLSNTMLDLTYSTAGLLTLALVNNSNTLNPADRATARGSAIAILTNGAMLMVFDATMYALSRRQQKRDRAMLRRLQLGM